MPIDVPNLDDRSSEELFAELRARIPVHTPEWTNLNEADPGITILQLFSFLADNLLYRSNRIPELNRRKFLSLLGVPLRPASPGLGLVTFSAKAIETLPIAAGLVVRAGKVAFRTQQDVSVVPVEARVFYKRRRADLDPETTDHLRRLHESFLADATTGLTFYDSVEMEPPRTGARLPAIDLGNPELAPVDSSIWVALLCTERGVDLAGNNAAAAVTTARTVLADATVSVGICPADRPQGSRLAPKRTVVQAADAGLVVDVPGPGPAPTYQRLVVSYSENVLDAPGVVHVRLPSLDRFVTPWQLDPSDEGTGDYPPLVQDRNLAARIVTWLRIRYRGARDASVAGGEAPAVVAWVGVNATRVVQAVRVVNESLGVGTGAPDQQFRTLHTSVLLPDAVAEPRVEIRNDRGEWEPWRRTDDLLAWGPAEPVYVLDPEVGMLTFGDGFHGRRPPLRAPIRATYEYGGGPQGLVSIDAIKVPDLEGVKVRNPLPTWGAAVGETTAEGERSIPHQLRHRDRLVTAADFRDIALQTPGVDLGRVDVLPLFDPRPAAGAGNGTSSPGMVTVMVVPRADALAPVPPNATDLGVVMAVCAWLDPRRLITTEVHVRGPRWVHIWISLAIALMPGEIREVVEQRVREAIGAFLSPLTGGPPSAGDTGVALEAGGTSPAGWPLGLSVRREDVMAAATRVAGVRYVEQLHLAARRGAEPIVSNVAEVALTGLELPHPTVFVTTGPVAEDPMALLGDRAATPSMVPVPVIPRKC